jgi:hypothetical protein
MWARYRLMAVSWLTGVSAFFVISLTVRLRTLESHDAEALV